MADELDWSEPDPGTVRATGLSTSSTKLALQQYIVKEVYLGQVLVEDWLLAELLVAELAV
jgi:hypothetical protein